MQRQELEELLDQKGVGDPALVDELDLASDSFRADLAEAETDSDDLAYLVGVASFYPDPVAAYEMLRLVRSRLARRKGGLRRFYEDQERVWRSRRDKSLHDLEYLRIVLGINDHLLTRSGKLGDREE